LLGVPVNLGKRILTLHGTVECGNSAFPDGSVRLIVKDAHAEYQYPDWLTSV